jgi:hypothetical protein
VDGATAVFSEHWMRQRQKGSEILCQRRRHLVSDRPQATASRHIDPEAKLSVKWSHRVSVSMEEVDRGNRV